MRPGPAFDVAAAPEPAMAAGRGGRLVWHSPVPCVFGGLLGMVGLIGFALLILACSYWKTSSFHEGGRGDASGGGGEELYVIKAGAHAEAEYEEQVVVIMAGDERPTYIATPTMSRPACAFGDRRCNNGSVGDGGDDEEEEESKVNGNETQRKEQSQTNNQNLEG